ncbi:MAG: hypothetical protein M5R36_02345 [Deltaproteobacteria bacterium]|nr:hypothetical protein [Deltaproteobacteria bacterium]
MSGSELARLFKSQEKLRRIPFLLLTGRAPTDEPGRGLAQRVAADDFITLPVDPTKLYAAVTKWLEGDERPSTVFEEAAGPLQDDDDDDPTSSVTGIGGAPTRGNVTPVNLTKVFLRTISSPVTGNLRVKSDRRKMKLGIRRGHIVSLYSNYVRTESLGRFLVDAGLISEEQNAESIDLTRKTKKRQGEVLLQKDG